MEESASPTELELQGGADIEASMGSLNYSQSGTLDKYAAQADVISTLASEEHGNSKAPAASAASGASDAVRVERDSSEGHRNIGGAIPEGGTLVMERDSEKFEVRVQDETSPVEVDSEAQNIAVEKSPEDAIPGPFAENPTGDDEAVAGDHKVKSSDAQIGTGEKSREENLIANAVSAVEAQQLEEPEHASAETQDGAERGEEAQADGTTPNVQDDSVRDGVLGGARALNADEGAGPLSPIRGGAEGLGESRGGGDAGDVHPGRLEVQQLEQDDTRAPVIAQTPPRDRAAVKKLAEATVIAERAEREDEMNHRSGSVDSGVDPVKVLDALHTAAVQLDRSQQLEFSLASAESSLTMEKIKAVAMEVVSGDDNAGVESSIRQAVDELQSEEDKQVGKAAEHLAKEAQFGSHKASESQDRDPRTPEEDSPGKGERRLRRKAATLSPPKRASSPEGSDDKHEVGSRRRRPRTRLSRSARAVDIELAMKKGFRKSQLMMLMAERLVEPDRRRGNSRRAAAHSWSVDGGKNREDDVDEAEQEMRKWLRRNAELRAEDAKEAAKELWNFGITVEKLAKVPESSLKKLRLKKTLRKKVLAALTNARLARYGLYSEAANCTFKPKLRRHRNGEDRRGNSSDEEGKDSQFLIRMEASERKRREARKMKQGKREYDASLDKKSCPNCGAVQAYDEVVERRNKCLNCDIEYRSKTSWAKVGDKFLERQENDLHAREKKLRDMAALAAKEEERSMLQGRRGLSPHKRSSGRAAFGDDGEGYVGEGENMVFWEDVKESFFRRLGEAEERAGDIRERLEEKYLPTFTPTISSSTAISNALGDFVDRMEEDNERRQERRRQRPKLTPGPATYSVPRLFGDPPEQIKKLDHEELSDEEYEYF